MSYIVIVLKLHCIIDGDLNATIGSPNRGANGEDKSQIKRNNNLTTQYDDVSYYLIDWESALKCNI